MPVELRGPAGEDDTASVGAPRPDRRRVTIGLTAFAALALVTFVLGIAVGSVTIPPGDVLHILFGGSSSHVGWETIVRDIRLPRAITATCCGAALAVGGVQMQTLFRNPLAGPDVLGITSGASFGVALVVLWSASMVGSGFFAGLGRAGSIGIAIAAALGALVVLASVLVVSRRATSIATVLIVGLMFGQVVFAMTTVLIAGAAPERLQAYLAWTFGSFRGVTWGQLRILVPVVVVGIAAVWSTAKDLNAMLLGDRYAASMGVDVRRVRRVTVVLASLLAGGVTAFAGPVGFIGVAAPHICRSILGTVDHRVTLPGSALVGAAAALIADIVAQTPGTSGVLPLNAITPIIGAPVVIWVVVRNRRATGGF